MTAMPADTPVTAPVIRPTEALDGMLEVQSPPGDASLKKVVSPTHTLWTPVMSGGNGTTVTMRSRIQPDIIVYVTITVPGVIPDMTPVIGCIVPIIAVPGLVLHTPPGMVLVRLIANPAQTV